MVICPHCNRPTIRSETLVPGHIVQGCRPCGVWRVAGQDTWIQSGHDLHARLVATVPVPESKRKAAYSAKTLPWEKLRFE
jgi:hypothetical protein